MKNLLKSISFILICAVLFITFNHITLPKYYYTNNPWPTTSTADGFYKMNKNTIDVLYFGASICVNEISPQEIYNKYGIRSYNLGSEQQNVMVGYYWLKEALRYQKPKVVVLDTMFCFRERHDPVMPEGLLRKCIDPIKWSQNKVEIINDICSTYPEQSKLSYYLTNFRFHTRWKETTKEDITSKMIKHFELKGYAPSSDTGPESCEPYQYNENYKKTVDIAPEMKPYLDKIVDLCKQNNIALILVTIPEVEDWKNVYRQNLWDGMTNTLNQYIAEHSDVNIRYINFMEKSVYEKMNVHLPKDDIIHHGNIWGSIKISDYLGKVLQDQYQLKPVKDDQYEETKDFYEKVLDNARNNRGYYDGIFS